ncbi:MAG: dihydrolipoamide acetyltransferase family protein [Patescibacteria group bacterium]
MLHFKFPDVGEGIIEGTIVKWHVKEGDTVKNDQVLAEIETDKAIVEIPSPRAGVILKTYGKENEMIKVGANLVTFGDPGEKFTEEAAPEKEPQRGVGVIGTLEVSDAMMTAPKAGQKTAPAQKAQTKGNFLPRTRILAEQLGVDLASLTGTGPDGRVTDEDVKNARNTSTTAADSASKNSSKTAIKLFGPADRTPYKGIRKIIGTRMEKSFQTIPHVTLMDQADVTKLAQKREQEKKEAEKKGIKLTFLPYIIQAIIAALQKYPIVNSSLDETTEEIILKKYYHIGFAVDTDEGLVVPVVKDADKKSLFELASEITALAEKARTRKIQPSEMEGGTFSVTNYGSFGGLYAAPIINHPEAGIMGIGRMKDAPVVTKEGVIESRKILPLSFAFDHRLFDGALGAKFLNEVMVNLESIS